MSGPPVDEDPWSVLGLARGVTDPAAIRRAYAQKVRAHRPEEDPAGFRRVRTAYEFLLRSPGAPWAFPETGSEAASDDAAGAAPEAGTPPTAPSEAAVLADRWIAAARLPEAAARDAALSEVAVEMTRGFGYRPALAGEVVREVQERAQQEPAAPMLARLLPPALLARLFRTGDPTPLLWSCATLLTANRLADVEFLAQEAGKALPDTLDPSLGPALVRLSRLLVIVAPGVARRLVDLAWRLAPPEERQQIGDQQIDFLLDVAREVHAWPEAARGHVARAAVLYDLSPEEAAAAVTGLQAAVKPMPEDAAVRWFLHGVFPDSFPSPAEARSGEAAHRRRRRRAAGRPKFSFAGGGFRVLWILFAIGAVVRAGGYLLQPDRRQIHLPEVPPLRWERPREGGLGPPGGEATDQARIRSLEERLRRPTASAEERAWMLAELAVLRGRSGKPGGEEARIRSLEERLRSPTVSAEERALILAELVILRSRSRKPGGAVPAWPAPADPPPPDPAPDR